MLIKAVQLSGFKSFVEPTTLPIDAGLTVIVGPNGCGKSNIIEAIRWVMGESSAKRLRGEGMDDVIFSGTRERTKRRSAQVALHLDNASGVAPAPFQDSPEIVVSRTIERGSGSVYRINGQEVRARDVQLLFADLSIGSQSASIISQGEIAELVDSKPDARRLLLEEAAGIRGLHARRREAELKLSQAENNLLRVQDILRQGQVNLVSLERQAKAGERYRQLMQQRRQYEALLWYLQDREIVQETQALEAEYLKAKENLDKVEGEQRNTQHEQTKISAKVLNLRADDEARLLAVQSARETLYLAERSHDRLKQQLDQAEERLHEWQADLAQEEERAQQTQQHLSELDAPVTVAKQSVKQDGASFQRDIAEYKQKRDEADTQLQKIQAEHQEYQEATIRFRERHGALESQKRQLSERFSELEKRKQSVSNQETEHFPDISTFLENAQQAEILRDQAVKQAELNYDIWQKKREEGSDLLVEKQKLNAFFNELSERSNELQKLEKIRNEHQEHERLIDQWIIPPHWQERLSSILETQLLASLETSANQKQCPALIDQIPDFPPDVQSLWQALQQDKVSIPKGWQILKPRLETIGLCADINAFQGLLKAGQMLVDDHGNVLHWHGLNWTLASTSSSNRQMEQRYRQEELRKILPEQQNSYTAQKDAFQKKQQAYHQELSHAEQVYKDSEKHRLQAQNHSQQTDEERRRAEQDLQRMQNLVAQQQAELNAMNTELETLLTNEQKIDDQLALLSRERPDVDAGERLVKNVSVAHKIYQQVQNDLENSTTALIVWQTEQKAASEAETRRVAEKQRLEQADLVSRERTKRLDAQIAGWFVDSDRQKRELVEAARTLSEAEKQRQAKDDARSKSAQALQDALAEESRNQRQLHKIEMHQAQRKESMQRLEISLEVKQQQREVLHQGAAQALQSDLPSGMEGLLLEYGLSKTMLDLSIPKVRSEHEAVHRRIASLGEVNLRAEIDATEQRKTLESLEFERDDIQSALEELRGAISRLNRHGNERLKASFIEMDRLFSRYFQQLFSGGEANLKWIESDDPIAPGIDIVARPPGKAMQSVHLLSGGEKALAALAMIAAVFKLTPTPICLLDEVDAALDDVNVERFCLLLKELSGDGQDMRFVVISHHRLSMAQADRLMGVGMPERGVSRLYAVDLLSMGEQQ